MKITDSISTELKQAHLKMLDYLQKHWRIFLIEGVVFMLLGIASIVIPHVSSVVIVLFLGWIIVFAGLMHAGRAIFFSDMPGFGLWLALGILQIVVGYLLLANPIAGVMTLTMMMALFFAFEGIIKIYLAFMIRPLPQWHFILVSGVIAFVFATIILAFWSETAHWLLGLFLGINMVILGWSMIQMSLDHKDNQ